MKIIIDARLLFPRQTGIGRYLLGLAQGFSNIAGSDEFEFWVQDNLPPEHQIWSLQNQRLKIRQMPIAHMSMNQQWAIPLKLRRTPHDIFHYPHFDLPFASTGKLVVTIHDLKYLVHPDYFPQLAKIKRLIMHGMMYFAVHHAQVVITVSNNTRNDIVRMLKIPADKIRVTPPGVDSRYFSNPNITTDKPVHLPDILQEPFVLYVGDHRPHKNITGVISAFNSFISMSSKPYKLVIAGKPYADYHAPEQLVESLGLSDRVCFIDSPPDKAVRLLFQSAEAFLFLSRYEGFGSVLLEAMASGTPIVAANTTSLPDVIGDAGLIVQVDDPETTAEALHQIVKGGEKRELLIARGLARAHQFTWERCAQQTLEIYQELQHL